MRPAVSVIIPVYNRQECIKNTVFETLKQTLQDLEVICIDDGSDDNTWIVLQELSKRDNRIKIFHKENGGAGTARNFGMHKAKGEYLFFLDSDDCIYNYESLEKLYNIAVETNANICGGKLYIRKDTELVLIKETYINTMGFVNFLNYQCNYYFTRFMYKTDFILENCIFFPELCIYEDPVFLLNVMDKCVYFYQSDVDVYIYNRIGRTNEIIDYPIPQLKDYIKGINLCLLMSQKNNYDILQNDLYNIIKGTICPIIEMHLSEIDEELLYLLICTNAQLDFDKVKIKDDGLLLYPILLMLRITQKYNKLKKIRIIKLIIKFMKFIRVV